jgi:hypothetical protein
MSETVSICEGCRDIVDPLDDSIVRAVEQVAVEAFGDNGPEVLDGLGVYFHQDCFPEGSLAYRVNAT